jgi:signal transduction histidine kinase
MWSNFRMSVEPAARSVRALFEANPNIMWIADGETHKFLAVNAAAVRRYGYSRAEFLRMTLDELRPQGETASDTDGPIQRHVTAWGEPLLVEASVHEIEFRGRAAQLAVVTDLTARLLAETKLRQRLNRLEAKYADASRQLRTAQQLVAGYSRLVGQEVLPLLARLHEGGPAGDTEDIEQVLLRMQRLEHLSTTAIDRQEVNLSEMAQAEINRLRLADPGRRVHVEIEPQMLADADPLLLRLLLAELLSNAWRFSNQARQPWIRIGRLEGNEPVPGFFVSDNGLGFDETVQGRIYLPFEKLHSTVEYPGAGLGLALARSVVKRHGGRLWARSQPGQGATFCFDLQPRPEDAKLRVREVVVDSLPPEEDSGVEEGDSVIPHELPPGAPPAA